MDRREEKSLWATEVTIVAAVLSLLLMQYLFLTCVKYPPRVTKNVSKNLIIRLKKELKTHLGHLK